MPDLSGPPTYLGALGRYLIDRVRGGGAETPPSDRGISLRIRGLSVPPRRLRGYLEVTRGHGIAALGPAGLLPPTVTGMWENACVLELLRIAGFPLPARGFIPLANERVQLRSLAATEPFALSAKLGACKPSDGGMRVAVAVSVHNRLGQLCATSELSLFVPGDGGAVSVAGTESPSPLQVEDREGWRTVRGWTLERSLGLRYARVSGDFNPSHLSSAAARFVGYERRILHGGCVEALIGNALIEGELGGDPTALRRIASRFSAPVALPAKVTLQIRASEGGGAYRLSSADDERPLVTGTWTGGAQG
jgi:acyl dehydratase